MTKPRAARAITIPLPGQRLGDWQRQILFDALAYYTGDEHGRVGVVALRGEVHHDGCWVAHLRRLEIRSHVPVEHALDRRRVPPLAASSGRDPLTVE